MIKKICLIQLPSEDALFGAVGAKLPPSALGIISSHLREAGFEVEPYDLMPRLEALSDLYKDRTPFQDFFKKEVVFDYVQGGENAFFEEFAERLLSAIPFEEYDLIGYSVGPHLSWIQTHAGLIFGRFIEKRFNKVQVFGGINLNTLAAYAPVYDELLKLWVSKFKYVIIGPGEESLLRLIQTLNADEDVNAYRQINGMGYLTADGQVAFNTPEKRKIIYPDFSGLLFSDYENYVKKDNYEENMISLYRYPFAFTKRLRFTGDSNSEYQKTLVIPYVFNYNCPYNCAFCVESDPDAPAPVIARVDKAVSDLEKMSQKYNTPYFYFVNNAVNCSKKFITSFCSEVISRGLKIFWSDCARFDNVDYDILVQMKEAGCRKLVFGMETASPGLIKRINKQIDLNYAKQVMEWCSQIGIWAELEIIVGMPTETPEDFAESYDYLKQNLKNINFMTINHYIPMPGSIMYRYPERFNIEIGEKASYEDILARDLELFKSGKNPISYNNMMKVYKYQDINGRNYDQVYEETVQRVKKVRQLMNGKMMQEVITYVQNKILTMNELQGMQNI